MVERPTPLDLDPLRKRVPTTPEILALCREYGLGDLVNVCGRLGGLLNVNIKVETTAGLYVIRVMSGLATIEHLRYAERITTVLQNAGMPALTPLRNQEGEIYSTLEGRIVQVHPFAEGKEFSYKPEQAYACGHMLHRLHEALAEVEPGPTPKWSNYPSKETLEEGLSRLRVLSSVVPPEQIDEAHRLYEDISGRWEIVAKNLPVTVIHGDWHPWNQLYSDGEVSCILDFDFVQRAERMHDVAYALWAMLSDMTKWHMGESLLKGYGIMFPEELDALPTAIARASIFFVCTASFTENPMNELAVQLERQCPFIEWVLSGEGERTMRWMCRS